MLIRRLSLENYRAFSSATLRLAPLTVLVGPNNAGKSSIVSSIRLLSQTLVSADPEATLLLEDLGSFPDVVHGNNSKETLRFDLEFERPDGHVGFQLAYSYRSQRRQVILREFKAYEGEIAGAHRYIIETSYSPSSGNQIIQEFNGLTTEKVRGQTIPFLHFFPRINFMLVERLRKGAEESDSSATPRTANTLNTSVRQSNELNRLFFDMQGFLRSLQYLGPFRQSPIRLYPFTGERPSKLGSTGSEAPDMLTADYFKRGKENKRLTKEVTSWLNRANIGEKLQVKAVSSRHYDVKMQHPTTKELANLADVGYGVSQILPVLVGGYSMPKDTLFMVEQPELHLHPGAQSELGEFFCSLASRGVQSIVETHSEHLILRIQQKVALGQMKPSDVAVSYVNPTSNGKEIVDLPIGEDGLFTRPWPNGFFEERMTEVLNLARAPILRQRAKSSGNNG